MTPPVATFHPVPMAPPVATNGLSGRTEMDYHLSLLKLDRESNYYEDASLSPIFMGDVLNSSHESGVSGSNDQISQYGLLAGVTRERVPKYQQDQEVVDKTDPRVFFNITTPSSTFICGSQGSGKSHTLSCLLESCLISSKAGKLQKPLTGLVFHYDTFFHDVGGSPCEAAFLSSHPGVEVRVLCAPTNLRTIQGTYSRFKIKVEPLQIDQGDLNTKRMLDLMAVGQDNGPIPLYMHTVQRILRQMRMTQQSLGTPFNYAEFKQQVMDSGLLPGQLEPLRQRLETLESFMPLQQATGLGKKKNKKRGTDWNQQPRQLTIVDLSCPCISSDTACSLFNICFSIFLEERNTSGSIVALDEAHKYMDNTAEAKSFTELLLSTVRLQRHLGIRVVVSTQEPTISKSLLSLCSVIIVHRFSSPEWLRALRSHIAAAAKGEDVYRESDAEEEKEEEGEASMFDRIVDLHVGEALLFSPTAIIRAPKGAHANQDVQRLGAGYLKIKVRSRLTEDGGKSVLSK